VRTAAGDQASRRRSWSCSTTTLEGVLDGSDSYPHDPTRWWVASALPQHPPRSSTAGLPCADVGDRPCDAEPRSWPREQAEALDGGADQREARGVEGARAAARPSCAFGTGLPPLGSSQPGGRHAPGRLRSRRKSEEPTLVAPVSVRRPDLVRPPPSERTPTRQSSGAQPWKRVRAPPYAASA
jgi:hypothetical protein